MREMSNMTELFTNGYFQMKSQRDEARVRVKELEAERTPRQMSAPREEAWFLAHVPDECVMSLRWIPATYGDFGEVFVDQNNKPIKPVDWIPMPPRVEPDPFEPNS